MAGKLSEKALETALDGLNGWIFDEAGGAIGHDFKFRDFSEAFGFIARVALLMQAADHHADWSNSYNRVSIALSTHSAGGVTQKDIDLAKAIDALLV